MTFLPLNIVRGAKLADKQRFAGLEGYIATADELVGYEGRFKDAVESLLSRTVVADTLEHANKIAAATQHRAKIVTLDGEVLMPGGAITGGQAKNGDEGALKRKNEIAAMKKNVAAQQKAYDALLEERQRLKTGALDLEQKYGACLETYEMLKETELAKMQDIRMIESQREKLISEQNACVAQKEKACAAIEALEEKKQVTAAQADGIRSRIAELKAELSKASSGGYKDDYLKAITEKNETEKTFIVLREKVAHRKEKLAEINAKYDEAVRAKKQAEQSVADLNAEIGALRQKRAALSEIDAGYEDTKGELEARFAALTARKEASSEAFYKLNDTIIALNKERGKSPEKISRFDVAIGKTEVEITHLKTTCSKIIRVDAEALKYRRK